MAMVLLVLFLFVFVYLLNGGSCLLIVECCFRPCFLVVLVLPAAATATSPTPKRANVNHSLACASGLVASGPISRSRSGTTRLVIVFGGSRHFERCFATWPKSPSQEISFSCLRTRGCDCRGTRDPRRAFSPLQGRAVGLSEIIMLFAFGT